MPPAELVCTGAGEEVLRVVFLDLLIVCLGICGSQGLFCFVLFFKPVSNVKPKSILEEGKSAVSERKTRDTFHPVLYLIQLPRVDVSDASAPTWPFGILPAHRASRVIIGREHKAGSQACWGRLVSMQIMQAFSPTWPHPSGHPLCT